jgi:hypothetical protein
MSNKKGVFVHADKRRLRLDLRISVSRLWDSKNPLHADVFEGASFNPKPNDIVNQ